MSLSQAAKQGTIPLDQCREYSPCKRMAKSLSSYSNAVIRLFVNRDLSLQPEAGCEKHPLWDVFLFLSDCFFERPGPGIDARRPCVKDCAELRFEIREADPVFRASRRPKCAKIQKPQSVCKSVLKPPVNQPDPDRLFLRVWIDKGDEMEGAFDFRRIEHGQSGANFPRVFFPRAKKMEKRPVCPDFVFEEV